LAHSYSTAVPPFHPLAALRPGEWHRRPSVPRRAAPIDAARAK